VTRTQSATDAGLSERQRKTALRLASIPSPAFERQVESPSPPTVTQLAQQGTATRERNIPSLWEAIECPETRGICETLERFATFCARRPAAGVARAINATEAVALRKLVETADRWLDQLVADLAAD
jgi:hypothetical protein